jgi:ATP-binding cassette subfamily B protein RaxB
VLPARPLYQRPNLLVLDEAISSLNVDLEGTVNAVIARLDLTRIIVAHRPETIRSAGRVVPLHGGQAVLTTMPG